AGASHLACPLPYPVAAAQSPRPHAALDPDGDLRLRLLRPPRSALRPPPSTAASPVRPRPRRTPTGDGRPAPQAQASRSAPAADRQTAGCTTRRLQAGRGQPAASPSAAARHTAAGAAGSPPLHSWANRRGVAPLAGCPARPWALGCSARLLRLHCACLLGRVLGCSIDAHASADASVDAPIVDTPIFDAPAAIDVDAPIETPATASNEEVEFNSSEIIVDPGLQKPIEEYHISYISGLNYLVLAVLLPELEQVMNKIIRMKTLLRSGTFRMLSIFTLFCDVLFEYFCHNFITIWPGALPNPGSATALMYIDLCFIG
ncbi:hypothetical protein U9M48_034847, partial [Paspalum notatum var. saurae]